MVMLREEMGKEGALLKRGAPFLWGGKAAHTLKLPTGVEGDHVHFKLASPCLQGEGDRVSGGRGWHMEK